MRVYMEQASQQIIEVRGISGRLLAMLDETEKLREESSFQRLEDDLKRIRVSLEQHLRGREKDQPSSVASTELPKLSSAFKKRETDPQAVDINARNLDFELAKSEQALVLKHKKEMTKNREELHRKEYEVRLPLQEQQFQHEVQRIKFEYDKRIEELKIAEMNQRRQAERKLASIELRHQFATCHKGSERGEDGATEPGEKVEDLPWANMKEKIDRLFRTTEETPAPKAPTLLAQHETSVPLLKVAKAILKTQKPDLKPFNGDCGKYAAFKASFRHLEEQGLYSENESLNLLLTTVKGEAEVALQGILPNSNGYYEAWRILDRRFGAPLRSYRLTGKL